MTRIVLTQNKLVSKSSKGLFFKQHSVNAKLRALVSSKAALEKENEQRHAARTARVVSRAAARATTRSERTSTPSLPKSRVTLHQLQEIALEEEKPRAWTPRSHDKQGMKHLLSHANAGLFADPGMGKTAISMGAIKVLKQQRMVTRTLVVAPLRPCYLVWPKERHKWTDFHSLSMEILHGPDKERALHRKADIYVINPDGLQWLVENHGNWLADVDLLIVDESTKFKHTNTKRFKRMRPLFALFKRRWILTGTPTPNGYMDLFGQIFIIDLGRIFGPYITHFRMNYFEPVGFGGFTWKLKTEVWVDRKTFLLADDTTKAPRPMTAEKAIEQAIAPYILRLEVDKKDMPELIENVIRVELPDDARQIYDELEEDLITTVLESIEVKAKNSAAASTKCRQVANGGLYYTDFAGLGTFAAVGKRKWVNLHNEKTDAIGDLYEQLQGSPLMVAYDFQHDLDRLTTAFPKAEVMGGGTSMKDSIRIEAAWNAGRIGMLLAQPQAMGHGLNLQSGPGHNLAIHSLIWDYEVYDQFVRRVWRNGQRAAHVGVHLIVARNTVDESVLTALRRKRRGQDALLAALRDYALKRRGMKN